MPNNKNICDCYYCEGKYCYRIDARDCEGHIDILVTECEEHPDCEHKQLNRLKAENDELQSELRQKKMTILMNNDHYLEVDKTNRQLKQTLTEIKEIVSSTLDCGEWIGQGDNKMEQILNKISEVEDD